VLTCILNHLDLSLLGTTVMATVLTPFLLSRLCLMCLQPINQIIVGG
jgi:hypothetical protein